MAIKLKQCRCGSAVKMKYMNGKYHIFCANCGIFEGMIAHKYHDWVHNRISRQALADKWNKSTPATFDRTSLEWLVSWCLQQEDPCITMSRGRELLRLADMQEMRDFLGGYDGKPRKDVDGRESMEDMLSEIQDYNRNIPHNTWVPLSRVIEVLGKHFDPKYQ